MIESDETTKYFKKIRKQSVRDDEGRPYVLCLREMATKSASDTLKVVKDIMFDLDNLAVQ